MLIAPYEHFSPTQIAGIDAFLRGSTVPGNDADSIQTWTDESGAGHNATQATAGKRAIIKDNIIGGRRIMRYDGTDDIHSGTMTAGAAKTIFIVLVKRSAAGTAGKSALGLGTNVNASILFTDTDLGSGYIYFGTQIAGVAVYGGTPTNASIVALNYTSASACKLWVNGGAAAASFNPDDSATTATSYNLGANNVGGSEQYGDYDVALLLIYNASLSNADMDRVGGYLVKEYGLTWAASS